MKTCPCEECLLVPTCRYKPYTKLMDDCSTLSAELYKYAIADSRYRRSLFDEIIPEVSFILKPTAWKINIVDDTINIHGLP